MEIDARSPICPVIMASVQIAGRALASHVGAFIAGGLLTTAIVSHAVPSSRSADDRYAALDIFAQSLSHVSNHYVDPVDDRKLIYGAVRGMLGSLDAHSSFLTPERYARLRQDTEGEFGGVGITLANSSYGSDGPGPPVIHIVIPGSPASKAGLAEGDRLLAIDGEPTIEPNTVVWARTWNSRLRGRPGTRVTLRVMRRSWPEPRTIVLVREHIKLLSVSSFLVEPGMGYIAVYRFHEATAADVEAALEDLAAEKIEGLILDLRGNPGGLLDQAVQVADLFLNSGTIVTIRGRHGTPVERQVAHGPGTWGKPLLVLVDQDTASAAEILAGALQDHGRATLVGLPTYGKGSVQTFLGLGDGSGLKLTTARYYTPRGKSLEHSGITPDIHVEADAEESAAAVPGDPGGKSPESLTRVVTGGAHPPKSATMPPRLAGDRQFEVAYHTVKRWLRSKKAARR